MHRKDKVRVSELNHADLALLTRAFITRAPIDRYFRVNNERPRIAIEANSADSIIAIVRGAPIATIMPSAIARQLPGLNAIPLTPSAGIWTLSVLATQGRLSERCLKSIYHDIEGGTKRRSSLMRFHTNQLGLGIYF
ncbi:MAG: hypothetical protein JSR99_02275 [Proteobacteria bacterium]|nr:hypothetical protein [Pseudomonadota bacterium]